MEHKKNIVVLGSTGSLGTQALDIIHQTPDVRLAALAARASVDLLESQIREFRPDIAALEDEVKAVDLRNRLRLDGIKTEILTGSAGVLAAAAYDEADLVINTIVGVAGLLPTMAALGAGKDLALANKESLVAAGGLVTKLAKEKGAALLPVDGEHSAIFQCLRGNAGNEIEKLLLTASGGPFRGYTAEQLQRVTVDDALKHPVWGMGRRITVDCATLMNKGFEVIEAHWLFGVATSRVEVLVHPQGVVHSMVEFADGAVMAQLGTPDMRLPVQYAINYPRRLPNSIPKLNLTEIGKLTFEPPDKTTFPCLRLAYDALKTGGTAPAALNGADEAAVGLFLEGKIAFKDIAILIENTLMAYTVKKAESAEDALAADSWARERVLKNCQKI